MAKNTLDQEITRQVNKGKMNLHRVEQRKEENNDLSKVIDYMYEQDEYERVFTVKGFTKEEVMQAAKFALKADPYDISVRHLDVEDSPVYYKMGKNNKLKSRGRLTRKDLDDAGKHLIKRAKEVKVILEQQKLEREEQ